MARNAYLLKVGATHGLPKCLAQAFHPLLSGLADSGNTFSIGQLEGGQ